MHVAAAAHHWRGPIRVRAAGSDPDEPDHDHHRDQKQQAATDREQRRGGRGPAGLTVGELEHERERVHGRRMAPMVDAGAELHGGLDGRRGDDDDPDRAGEQRRETA